MLPFALLAFSAGVVLLQLQPTLPPPAPWLAGGAGALVVATLFRGRLRGGGASRARAVSGVAAAAAVAGALALGFGYAALRAEVRLADALPTEWEGEDIVVVGVVDDLPVAGPRGTRFAFAVEAAETPGAVVPARIALTWYRQAPRGGASDDVPEIRAGERWRLIVRLKRPHGNVNPGGFDVEAWLLEQNLRATGYIRTGEANVRVDAFAGRPRDHVQRARAAVRARIEAALDGAPHAGVIVALAIGEQRAIPERQWQVFNRTGIGHLISISGLHVTAFAALAGVLAFGARAAQRAADVARAGAPRGGAGGHAGRRRVRAARRGAGAGGAHAADGRGGRRGPLAGAARQRVAGLVVGAGRGAAVGSVGVAGAGILAVVRRRGAAALRGRRPAGGAARRFVARATRGRARRGRPHAGAGDDRPRAAVAGAVPAGVAGVAGRERVRDPGRHVRRRPAGVAGHRRAAGGCRGRRRTPCSPR